MNGLYILKDLDAAHFRAWFRNHFWSKLVTIIGFALVAVIFSFSLWLLSWTYFSYLGEYQNVGLATKLYTLRMGVLVIVWLLTLFAGFSWYQWSKQFSKADWLRSLPIANSTHIWWQLYKTVISGGGLLLLLCGPIIFAFHQSKLSLTNLLPILQAVAVFFWLSLLISSLAGIICLMLWRWLRYIWVKLFILGLIAIDAVVVLRLVLPRQLRILYSSQPNEFNSVFAQLPLNQAWTGLPYLSKILTQPMALADAGLVIGSASIVLGLFFLIAFVVKLRPHPLNKASRLSHKFRWPLMESFLLGVWRNKSERNYSLALLSLFVFFGFILSRSRWLRQFEPEWQWPLIIGVWIWLTCINLAYGLRVLFPLFVRHRDQFWVLAQNSRGRLFSQLMTAGLIIWSPILIFTSILAFLLPLQVPLQLWFVLAALALTALIQYSSLLLGVILPQFDAYQNPEASSTSGAGLSIIVIGIIFLLILLGVSTLIQWQIFSIGLAGLVIWSAVILSLTMMLFVARVRFYLLDWK